MKATRSGCGQRWSDHAAKLRNHEQDVLEAQERAQEKFIKITVPHEDNHRARPHMSPNPLMTFIKGPDGRMRMCGAMEWDRVMKKTRSQCKGYRDEKGKWHSREPIGASLVNTHPAWSDVMTEEAYRGLPRVTRFLMRMVQLLADMFEALTGRRVLGVAVHLDSRSIHFDIAHTRQQEATAALLGHKALGIVGLDSIAELRNANYGIVSLFSRIGEGGEVQIGAGVRAGHGPSG